MIKLESPSTAILVQVPIRMRAPRVQPNFCLRIGHPPRRGFVRLLGIALLTRHQREPMHDPQQCELIQRISVAVVAVRSPQFAISLPARHKRLAFNVSKGRANPHTCLAVDSRHEQRRVLLTVRVSPVLDHVVGVCTGDRHVVIRG